MSTLVVDKVQNTLGQVLNGNSKSVQVFAASGTWTKPVGITTIRVQVVGAGGGSSGYSESGGAGGYSERILDVTNITSVAVTVGTGGAGTSYAAAGGAAGGAGGTSSFGIYCSATGGAGANSQLGHTGGGGGIGSGGYLNLRGGGGCGHNNPHNQSGGGVSYFGGPASRTTHGLTTGKIVEGAPGAGASGGASSAYLTGIAGENGLVIVSEY